MAVAPRSTRSGTEPRPEGPVVRQWTPAPAFRSVRVFAVDPGLTARFETAVANEATLQIPWEEVQPGPSGEYVAIVDEDVSGKRRFAPLDLNIPEVLSQNGLTPSEDNPLFRQQMTYAVAMRTIHNFERALGRPVLWAPRNVGNGTRRRRGRTYQGQLRIYPHYTEVKNAYYVPGEGLTFGYFQASEETEYAGETIFTCLSQDTIAHTLTHAILDGMDISFEGTHPDVMALHEAFADLIALLQHFEESDVLRLQIAQVQGDLRRKSILGAVALQFGQTTGRPDGIRNALGYTDSQGVWTPRRPDPDAYRNVQEPHERGNILVAAMFAALVRIYESRVADLCRIATRGSGILPEGSLHPDLVERLTREASKAAEHVLDMCISALDYLPSIEATFSDFMRAIITADCERDPRDDLGYRVAITEGFRNYGIHPRETSNLSVKTLLWPKPTKAEAGIVAEFFREKRHSHWTIPTDRKSLWTRIKQLRSKLKVFLRDQAVKEVGRVTRVGPIDLRQQFEVVSLHLRQRGGPTGELATQWIVNIVQRSSQASSCTLIIDADTGIVKYRIDKKGTRRRPARVLQDVGTTPSVPVPPDRKVRVFAFDPSMGVQIETAGINEVTLAIPWEQRNGKSLLEVGPAGEYLEVIDRDPASDCYYEPIDLNAIHILAQGGLPPSEGNPQFHQQMVYAVAMRTIRNFESALGRRAMWSARGHLSPQGKELERSSQFVPRLRLHPHALREANAYYSPEKKAILFGYFSAPAENLSPIAARPTVFTCLSHDIIAHEMTHALLDGMHHRFVEPSNADVLAFHEAFADVVALFQHFSLPDVLRHQIAATRGDLATQNMLGELAQQVGAAVGRRGALRNAIGETDATTGAWKKKTPDPGAYQRLTEPHERGGILVAAIFDAFLTIYKSRVADLIRIATEGTGVLPEGQLQPDMVHRLASEAADAAQYVLRMCIRALDYCPPVDITFGEYLRAILTADHEYDPIDRRHRRVAFVEAFRAWGIIPADVRTLSVDGLLWSTSLEAQPQYTGVLASLALQWAVDIASWGLSKDREALYWFMLQKQAQAHTRLKYAFPHGISPLIGPGAQVPFSSTFEVNAVRPSIWTDVEGKPHFQWIVGVLQRRPEWFDSADQAAGKKADYQFRAGSTLLVDAQTGIIRHNIQKPGSRLRFAREREYRTGEGLASLEATYFGKSMNEPPEPFALLHRL